VPKPIMRPGEVTALSGALIRWGPNLWAWSDHTLAPMVRDVPPSQVYHFRFRTYAQGADAEQEAFVEVPTQFANHDTALAWVLTEGFEHSTATRHRDKPDGAGKGGARRGIILVPLSEWKAWDAQWSMGAQWPEADETAVLEKAYTLKGHRGVSGVIACADPASAGVASPT